MAGFNRASGAKLEQVRATVVGKDSEAAVRALKVAGFGYVETAYPVVVWRRGPELVEVHYRAGRVSEVKRQG